MASRANRRRRGVATAALGVCMLFAARAHAVRITELMYHPSSGEGEPDLEFIEIFNEEPTALDLLGYDFCQGVRYTFEERIFLDPGAYLVIAADPEAVKSAYGIDNVVGPWGEDVDGELVGASLANNGERVSLCDNAGVVRASVRYNDRGKWPGAPDGTGHSLELEKIYGEQDDPDNWNMSGTRGGSPGSENDTLTGKVPVVFNEMYSLVPDGEERFIELYNKGTEPVDLTGYFLSTDRDELRQMVLPEGTEIAPGEYLKFTETELGADLAVAEPGERVTCVLTAPSGERVIDARTFRPRVEGLSEARIPDGSKTFSEYADPTPTAANSVSVVEDVVIHEIHYHPIDDDDDKEFIELYNRGSEAVDVSGWEFNEGIDFTLPDGTTIAADGYLVVARNADAIRAIYELPAGSVVGPQDAEAAADFGRLANGGERVTLVDDVGRVAGSVRYFDGGEWPAWTDGGGSSLELIDPFQDSSGGQAWDASDDSDRAPVTTFEYTGVYTSGTEPELHIVLPGRGITIVDDLKMVSRVTTVNPLNSMVAYDSTWRYFKGTTEPPADWTSADFDDGSWLSGQAILGYGEDDETTVIEDMRGLFLAVFFRQEFSLDAAEIDAIRNLILEVEYDDGFAVYLNGTRVVFENLREDPPTIETKARSSRDKAVLQFNITEHAELLRAGSNLLAVEVHNSTLNSNDFRFRAQLVDGEFQHVDSENKLVDGNFDTEDYSRNWTIQGTHAQSGRTIVDPLSGDGSLKVISTGNGDNKVNRIETNNRGLTGLVANGEYNISFQAKWEVGVASILTHGAYNGTSPASHALSHQLTLPDRFGTPGAANTATARQVARTGSANVGPVITKVKHVPAVPVADEEVVVSARVRDSDGVRDVMLNWAIDTAVEPGNAALQTVPMTDPDGDGVYTASIPGQALRKIIVFHVTATDDQGAGGRFPLDYLGRAHAPKLDPDDTTAADAHYAVYQHDRQHTSTRVQSYRAYMHKANETYLNNRALHSNELVDSTFIFGDEDAYYNSKVRFSGSPWARQKWQESWRVRMPDDKSLHGQYKKFGMEDHQGAGGVDGRERVSHYLLRFNQGSTPVPYSTQWLVQWKVNSRVTGIREHYNMPSRELLELWYPDNHQGFFFEMDDRHTITDSGTRAGSNDAFVRYPPNGSRTLGPDKEQYRYYFMPRGGNTFDEWGPFIEMCRVMTPGLLPDEEFDERIFETLDVEEVLRVWSIRLNTADWDTWGYDRGKNCYWYQRPDDQRWVILPWDMELTYELGRISQMLAPRVTRTSNPNFNMGKFSEATRFMNRPRVKRMYYGILNEMVHSQFDSAFLTPFMQKLDQAGVQQTAIGKPNGFIDRRRRSILSNLTGSTMATLPFAVTTNGGDPLLVDSPVVSIQGEAPVEIFSIEVLIDGEPTDAIRAKFDRDAFFGWTAVGTVPEGTHRIEFIGFDSTRQIVIAATGIDVTLGDFQFFARGDVDLSGKLSVSDPVQTLLHLFQGKSIPCEDAADFNDDGDLNQSDAIACLNYLFADGAPPASPYPAAGVDESADALSCVQGVELP